MKAFRKKASQFTFILLAVLLVSASGLPIPTGNASSGLTLTPVYSGSESTIFSIYGTSPESPDGERIVYVKVTSNGGQLAARGVGYFAELWICDVDLTNHRKVANINITNHNGANAFWVDNSRIAYYGSNMTIDNPDIPVGERFGGVTVIDVDTNTVLHGPIPGKISHDAVNGKLLIGLYETDVHKVPAAYQSIMDEGGIYQLDVNTGVLQKMLMDTEMRQLIEDEGYQYITDGNAESIWQLHPQFNPSGTKFMTEKYMRINGARESAFFFKDIATGELTLQTPGTRPMHMLWYDDNTYYAADDKANDGNPNNRELRRWNLNEQYVETLAGLTNHGSGSPLTTGSSPEREWFVGDTWYNTSPVYINLYKKGQKYPVAILDEMSVEGSLGVWEREMHANPVFSRDGKSVYFMRMESPTVSRAVRVDVSSIVDATTPPDMIRNHVMNFNDGVTSAAPQGWHVTGQGGTATVEAGATPGEKQMVLADTSTTRSVVVTRALPITYTQPTSVEWNYKTEDVNRWTSMKLQSNGANFIELYEYTATGESQAYLYYRNSNNTDVKLFPVQPDQWYNIKLQLDFSQKKAAIYVDGVRLTNSEFTFKNSGAVSFNGISFNTNNNRTNTVYIDDIRVQGSYLWESFNGTALGNAPAGWSIVKGDATQTTATVVQSTSAGSRVLSLNDTSTTKNVVATKTLSQSVSGKAVIEWDFNTTGTGKWTAMRLKSGNTAFLELFDAANMQQNGQFMLVYREATQDTPLIPLTPDTWYHVKAVVDFSSKKADIYVNGVLAGSQLPFKNTSVSSVNAFEINTSNGSTNQVYLENLIVLSE